MATNTIFISATNSAYGAMKTYTAKYCKEITSGTDFTIVEDAQVDGKSIDISAKPIIVKTNDANYLGALTGLVTYAGTTTYPSNRTGYIGTNGWGSGGSGGTGWTNRWGDLAYTNLGLNVQSGTGIIVTNNGGTQFVQSAFGVAYVTSPISGGAQVGQWAVYPAVTNVLPGASNVWNLGSEEYPFASLFLGTSSIHFVGQDGVAILNKQILDALVVLPEITITGAVLAAQEGLTISNRTLTIGTNLWAGGSGGISEAPIDGDSYVRRNAEWYSATNSSFWKINAAGQLYLDHVTGYDPMWATNSAGQVVIKPQ
jgi:hypothetical protein